MSIFLGFRDVKRGGSGPKTYAISLLRFLIDRYVSPHPGLTEKCQLQQKGATSKSPHQMRGLFDVAMEESVSD
jgi:hypothetical protein